MSVRCPDCKSRAFFYTHEVTKHYTVSRIHKDEDIDIDSYVTETPTDKEPLFWCEACGWEGSVKDFLKMDTECSLAQTALVLGYYINHCQDVGRRKKDWCANCKREKEEDSK